MNINSHKSHLVSDKGKNMIDVPGNVSLALLLTVLAGLSTGIEDAIAYFMKVTL